MQAGSPLGNILIRTCKTGVCSMSRKNPTSVAGLLTGQRNQTLSFCKIIKVLLFHLFTTFFFLLYHCLCFFFSSCFLSIFLYFPLFFLLCLPSFLYLFLFLLFLFPLISVCLFFFIFSIISFLSYFPLCFSFVPLYSYLFPSAPYFSIFPL